MAVLRKDGVDVATKKNDGSACYESGKPALSIFNFIKEVGETNEAHGFHEANTKPAEYIALIHSELPDCGRFPILDGVRRYLCGLRGEEAEEALRQAVIRTGSKGSRFQKLWPLMLHLLKRCNNGVTKGVTRKSQYLCGFETLCYTFYT